MIGLDSDTARHAERQLWRRAPTDDCATAASAAARYPSGRTSIIVYAPVFDNTRGSGSFFKWRRSSISIQPPLDSADALLAPPRLRRAGPMRASGCRQRCC